MLNYISAEYQKLKRTFAPKLIWFAPLITFLLCFPLMPPLFFQQASYNWWYTTLLPGTLTILCTQISQKDAKTKYRAMLSLPIDLWKLWISKIIICTIFLFATCMLFETGSVISGKLFFQAIPFTDGLLGSLLLVTTFAWQIPFCLFLSSKYGTFTTILINFSGNIFISILLATKPLWWLIPYAIPHRLMCPILKIMPNGLPVVVDSPLLNSNVVFLGALICLVLYISLCWLTSLWFQKQEEK